MRATDRAEMYIPKPCPPRLSLTQIVRGQDRGKGLVASRVDWKLLRVGGGLVTRRCAEAGTRPWADVLFLLDIQQK